MFHGLPIHHAIAIVIDAILITLCSSSNISCTTFSFLRISSKIIVDYLDHEIFY